MESRISCVDNTKEGQKPEIMADYTETESIEPEPSETPLSEDGSSKLAFLIRIPVKDTRKKLQGDVFCNGGEWG